MIFYTESAKYPTLSFTVSEINTLEFWKMAKQAFIKFDRSFGDKIFKPSSVRGTRVPSREISFKVSNGKADLMMHRWKCLFKTINFT